MSDRRISRVQSEQVVRIVRFLLVGGLTFVVYYALLYILHTGAGMRYPLAIAISYSLAVALHFLINRRFTFAVRLGRTSQQLRRYGLTALINYCMQILIVRALFETIGFGFYWTATIAVATTTVTGFMLMDKWVFTRTERQDWGH
jgi:putative flippase GtrA